MCVVQRKFIAVDGGAARQCVQLAIDDLTTAARMCLSVNCTITVTYAIVNEAFGADKRCQKLQLQVNAKC